MQISVLRKLLQLISPQDSPEATELSEEISELNPTENEITENNESVTEDAVTEVDEIEPDTDCEEEIPLPADTKAHLTSSVPRAAKAPQDLMTKGELAEIRALFKNLSDKEIQRLYKRVTKNT